MSKLSIIMPSCNEKNVELMKVECRLLFPDAQIIVGDDFARRGKGYIIKQSIYNALGDIIVFIDGDMDIHPRMILRLLPFLSDFDIVVGSKSICGYPLRRKLITWLSRLYIKLMFNLDVDTQTGIKAFNRFKVPQWSLTGFFFDVELLYLAKKEGISMVEVPIIAKSTKQKSMGVLWVTFVESVKVWFRLSFQSGAVKISRS